MLARFGKQVLTYSTKSLKNMEGNQVIWQNYICNFPSSRNSSRNPSEIPTDKIYKKTYVQESLLP